MVSCKPVSPGWSHTHMALQEFFVIKKGAFHAIALSSDQFSLSSHALGGKDHGDAVGPGNSFLCNK